MSLDLPLLSFPYCYVRSQAPSQLCRFESVITNLCEKVLWHNFAFPTQLPKSGSYLLHDHVFLCNNNRDLWYATRLIIALLSVTMLCSFRKINYRMNTNRKSINRILPSISKVDFRMASLVFWGPYVTLLQEAPWILWRIPSLMTWLVVLLLLNLMNAHPYLYHIVNENGSLCEGYEAHLHLCYTL